jgi:hypothetical protein
VLQSYVGYWDDGRVLSIGSPIRIAKNRKVIITELDEQEQESIKVLTIEEKLAAMAEIDRMVAESADENYVFDDFEPARTSRKLIEFSDEE